MDVFHLNVGEGPLAAAAIHHGHAVRPEVAALLALSEQERLREEDPFTELLAEVAPTRLIGRRSRFEIDLNRPRDKAVYLQPADAWGLNVWKGSLPTRRLARLAGELRPVLRHRADRPRGAWSSGMGAWWCSTFTRTTIAATAPTGRSPTRRKTPRSTSAPARWTAQRWAPVVDGFIDALRQFDYRGRQLDVRENVKFRRRPLLPLDSRDLSRLGLRHRRRVQKVLDERMDRRGRPCATGGVEGGARLQRRLYCSGRSTA